MQTPGRLYNNLVVNRDCRLLINETGPWRIERRRDSIPNFSQCPWKYSNCLWMVVVKFSYRFLVSFLPHFPVGQNILDEQTTACLVKW